MPPTETIPGPPPTTIIVGGPNPTTSTTTTTPAPRAIEVVRVATPTVGPLGGAGLIVIVTAAVIGAGLLVTGGKLMVRHGLRSRRRWGAYLACWSGVGLATGAETLYLSRGSTATGGIVQTLFLAALATLAVSTAWDRAETVDRETPDDAAFRMGVPDLVGLTVQEAERAMAAAPYRLEVPGAMDSQHRVVAQAPLHGELAPLGSLVTVTVGTRPLVRVRNEAPGARGRPPSSVQAGLAWSTTGWAVAGRHDGA